MRLLSKIILAQDDLEAACIDATKAAEYKSIKEALEGCYDYFLQIQEGLTNGK